MARGRDDQAALALVLVPQHILWFSEEVNDFDIWGPPDKARIDVLDKHRVSLEGPSPLLETKQEFLRRAEIAWSTSVAGLSARGLSSGWPRHLEKHCDWLVRYHVNSEMAPTILADDEVSFDTKNQGLYKAVEALRVLIDLPRRSRHQK